MKKIERLLLLFFILNNLAMAKNRKYEYFRKP